MPDVLIRHLRPKTLSRLNAQAKAHGRSLHGEVKQILTNAMMFSSDEVLDVATDWQQRLPGWPESDSTELIHEDRER